MKSLTIFIAGDPIPQGRPRGTIIKPKYKPAFIQFYDPPECQKFKDRVARLAKEYLAKTFAKWEPINQPISIEITFFLNRIKIVGGEKKEWVLKGTFPATAPDIDNLIKAVTDALNGIIWSDDKNIVEIVRARKLYADGREPGFEITVRPFGQPEFDPIQEALI